MLYQIMPKKLKINIHFRKEKFLDENDNIVGYESRVILK